MSVVPTLTRQNEIILMAIRAGTYWASRYLSGMNNHDDARARCCAECGKEEGGVSLSLKTCKSCNLVKYCNANCQRNHWPKHKKLCKQRAAELRDEALFKDPPAKEDCPICFLPMPIELMCCISLPPATIYSVPIHYFASANEAHIDLETDMYYPCCGKCICKGCVYTFCNSEQNGKCPFCTADQDGKTGEENVEDTMKRAEANDPVSMSILARKYYNGVLGVVQQDRTKAIELFTRSSELGYSDAHYNLAVYYYEGGDKKKAKFHNEAAAMAGHEVARNWLACFEFQSGNIERAIKHWTIAASAGHYSAMFNLQVEFMKGAVSRESIDSILTSYNNSCAEMRSEARDATVRAHINHN